MKKRLPGFKKKILSPIRLSEREDKALKGLRSANPGLNLSDLIISAALRDYDRGFMVNEGMINRLIGCNAILNEGTGRSMIFSGRIISIYPWTPNQSLKINRPFLYVHFILNEPDVESIAIWGFGNPLTIAKKKYYAESFMLSTRPTCYQCNKKLTKNDLGEFLICKTCFPEERHEDIEVSLI